MDYKNWVGILATIVAIVSYLPYLYGIYKNKTKPHAFTWFVWGSINVVAFAAVLVSGGGNGSWILLVNILACYLIAGIAFRQGVVKYDLYDWLALCGGLIGILLWWLTSNPLFAVILIALSDGIGFIPSYRKAFKFPWEENISSFAIGVLYYILGLFALRSFNYTTALYPIMVIIWDSAFTILVLLRRRQVAK